MRRCLLFLCTLAVIDAPQMAGGQSTPNTSAEVTLQPGDIVRVVIWREEDLSGDFPVNEDGIVTFPLLGDRQVLGASIPELREALVQEYRTELRNPSIFLTPLRRISVLGEVRVPNVYTVDPTVTLGTAIALAGGASPTGDMSRIRVRRGDQLIRYRVGATETLANIDIRSGDEIIVDQINWFARNSTVVFSTGVSLLLFTMSMLLR